MPEDAMTVLANNFSSPHASGQAAFQGARDSLGLGAPAQPKVSPMPSANMPAPQPAAPAPQPPVADAVSAFEGRLNAARPGGWPAVKNVYNVELETLWLAGANKPFYDGLSRRLMAEEQAAAQAAPAPATPPVV